MKKFLFIAGLLFTVIVQAQTTELIDTANIRYSEGKFNDAISAYQKVIKAGYVSPEVFYNLGNCYYRTGDFPAAILNFERARQLSPNDEDIKFNLHMAYMKVAAKNETKPDLTVSQWMRDLRMLAGSNTWAVWSVIGFISLLAAILFFLFTSNMLIKKTMLGVGIFSILFTVISVVFSWQRKHDVLDFNTAVISAPTVTVKSSPDANGNDVFIVYEGAMVTLRDSIPGWKNVALQNGEVGWVPDDAVIMIP